MVGDQLRLRVKVMGKLWNLLFVPESKIPKINGEPNTGLTDSPGTKDKSMRVATELEGEERFEIILHELMHAGNWHLDEEFVREFCEDAARIFWRLGYRQMEGL